MKGMDIKKVLNLLGFILRCPVCGYRYNLETMRVVESEQNEAVGEARLVIHSDCQQCKGSVMFAIGMNGPEVMSAATVTDLTLSDASRFRNTEPLSADDVLHVHRAVRGFKGDFIKALKK
jgi:hypothetical protein